MKRTKNKKHKKNKKTSGKHLKNLKYEIHKIFRNFPERDFTPTQIFNELGIRDKSMVRLITELIKVETDKGILTRVAKGKYIYNKELSNTVIGIIDISPRGKGYLQVPGQEEDLQIRKEDTGTALSGDTVRVSFNTRGNRIKGHVEEIIQRGKSKYVGIIQLSKSYAFFVPSGKNIHRDFFIANRNLNGAKDGDKVIVSLLDWVDPSENPNGRIIEVLGKPGDNEVEMHAIMVEYGLPYKFPKEVEDAADRIDSRISKEEIKKRKDFRDITTFTIDPVDAKDFDDALSYKKLENGNLEVGVHIADVSHYLKPNSILDVEAVDRATSVYLVDRTIPMLPEVLSNKLCSLRPNEEKLCFSAVFEMDSEANVVNKWFGRTIINSDRRFTYEEAQERIETGNGDYADEINEMDKLAKIMRAARHEKGGLDFHSQEVKFRLDDAGKPIGVYVKEMKDSNRMIEDFMLLANKEVSRFIGSQKPTKTFIYRVHDLPNSEKLTSLRNFVFKFGYKIPQPTPNNAGQILRDLLAKVHGTPEENIIQPLAIRSMSKAIYTTENIGHFGLGFEYYSHFTSPIRRYPDVMVHRLLQHYLDGNSSANKDENEELCKHSSKLEKKAQNAEWASISYKQVEYMNEHLGDEFTGIITGMTSRGMFVELTESLCDGMVRLDSITGDRYVFDESDHCVKGSRKGNEYHLGQEIQVVISKANLSKRQLDFEMAD